MYQRLSPPMSRVLIILLASLLAACATSQSPPRSADSGAGGGSGQRPHYKVGSPYTIKGRTYKPRVDRDYDEVGVASWYGDAFHRKLTANGEIFDKNLLSAAHKTLPLPTIVEVENLENGRRIELRVNDRGPFVDNRIIDLSEAAARALGFDGQGLAKVRVRYLGDADLFAKAARPNEGRQRYAARETAPGSQPSARQVARPVAPEPAPVETASLGYATSAAAIPSAPRPKPDIIASLIAEEATQEFVSSPAEDEGAQAEPASPISAGTPSLAFNAPFDTQGQSGYWVEIMAASQIDDLDSARVSLSTLGAMAIFSDFDPSFGEVHSLRVGPYGDLGTASIAHEKAISAGFYQAEILSAP